MATQRKTGAAAAKAASKVLRSKSTGATSKTAAGSVLSQRAPKRAAKVTAVGAAGSDRKFARIRRFPEGKPSTGGL
jgi:hypothetical protein